MDVIGGTMLMSNHYDIRGGLERIDYLFEDGPYLRISGRMIEEIVPDPLMQFNHPLEQGRKIEVGPYRFRVLEYELMSDIYLTIQDKWPLWWLAVAWHKINKLPDLFYRRLIVTLAIWKLADYSGATVPYIGDVHLVQKVKRWLTHT